MKQLWNGVSAVPRQRFRKGERHWSRGGARDGGHSFCFVLRWQLVVHADLKPYSLE